MSSTKTTTESTAGAGAGDSAKQGTKVAGDDLPPPNANINPDREDDLTALVDLLADAENEREVFTGQYKNADYLLKEYRESLRAVLEVDHKERDSAYRVLANAIFLHKKAQYQPIRDQVLDWARSGYNGEPPHDYFDADGKKREISDEDDPEYTKRKADVDDPMEEDVPDLPKDMTFYEEKWKLATPLLDKLFRTPRLYKDTKGKCRTHLDQINYDLKKRQQEDGFLDVDLTVPVFMMMYTLVHATEAMMKANRADSEAEKAELMKEPNQELALVKQRIERAHQPPGWAESLEERAPKKAKLMEEHASDTTKFRGGWEKDFLQSLKEFSEPFQEKSKTTSPGPEPKAAAAEDDQSPEAASEKTSNSSDKQSRRHQSGKERDQQNVPKPKKSGFATATGERPFEPSGRKGFVRYKLLPDIVTYLGQRRKIGYSRLVGRFLRGEAYQVLVQVNEESSPIPIWDIVPSSHFDKGVIKRFHDGGGKDVANMKGKVADIGEKTIDEFNFGGIATIPRGTGEGYQRKPMQLILGCFDGEDEKFWDRSTLGQAWRQKAIDEIIESLIVEAGGALQPKPELRGKRKTKSRSKKGKKQVEEDGDEEDEDEEEEEDEQEESDGESVSESEESDEDKRSRRSPKASSRKFSARKRDKAKNVRSKRR